MCEIFRIVTINRGEKKVSTQTFRLSYKRLTWINWILFATERQPQQQRTGRQENQSCFSICWCNFDFVQVRVKCKRNRNLWIDPEIYGCMLWTVAKQRCRKTVYLCIYSPSKWIWSISDIKKQTNKQVNTVNSTQWAERRIQTAYRLSIYCFVARESAKKKIAKYFEYICLLRWSSICTLNSFHLEVLLWLSRCRVSCVCGQNERKNGKR